MILDLIFYASCVGLFVLAVVQYARLRAARRDMAILRGWIDSLNEWRWKQERDR